MVKIVTSRSLYSVRKLLTIVLYALLVTPLLVSARYFFPFITTKTLYFRLLVEIAVVLYAILAIADIRFRPIWNRLTQIVVTYSGVVFVAALIGSNFYRSFWGNTERGEGILTLLHVIVFFFILLGTFRDWKDWEHYFTASVLVSLVSAFYATAQKFGASFVLAGDVSRISATIGNAAFYAGYLLTNIFLAVFLVYKKPAKWQKIFFGAVIVYELLVLNATRTRGALVGLILGIVIMLFLAAITSERKRVRFSAISGLILLVVLGATVYALRDTKLILNAGGLHNITHISRDDITTESRLLTWEASWEGWKDRFFQGYGYENFNVAFNKYFPAKIYRDSGSQIWFDRAHNVFFETSVTSGIFGILSYLGIYLVALWFLFRYYRRDPQNNRAVSIILSAFLVAYFVQNLFVFDTLGTYISFYSVLGFIVFLKSQEKELVADKYSSGNINPYLTIVFIIALVFVAYNAVIKPHKANIAVTKALIATAQGDFQGTMDAYREVIEMGNYVTEEARQKLGEAVITMRNVSTVTNEVKQRGYRYAIEQLREQIEESPYDARNYLFLMALYNNFPSNEAGQREEVIRLGKEAIELSPTRPQIYFEMGQAAHSLGRFDEGIGYFEKGVEINPDPAESRWNLALAYFIAGRMDEGQEQIDWLFDREKIGKITSDNLRNLVQIYSRANIHDRKIRIFEELLRRSPNDAKVHAELASIYAALCQQSNAKDQADIAVSLDPSYSDEAEQFLFAMTQNCTQ